VAKTTQRRTTTPVNSKPRRESDEAIRARGVTPFLRPEHVRTGEVLKLTGFNSVRERDTDREQIVCEVENEIGESFSLGVRSGSPDHRVLHRALGPDSRKWIGSVEVKIVDGRQRDTQFVNVVSADRGAPVWDGGALPVDSDEPGAEG
jgi:hypothetical protein